jgi:hypothetical protein
VPGLARQRQSHRFEIDQRFAAEPAADLGRGDADIGNVNARQFRAIGANHKLALTAGPDLHLAVGRGRDDAGMRLDIRLMHRLGRIAPLDNDVRLAETGRGVALRKGHLLGDVRGLFRLRVNALGKEVVVQQRCIRRHRRLDVDHVRQRLILDFDQLYRLGGDNRRQRSHRGHRMTFVKRPVPCHDIARQVAEVHRAFADKGLFRADFREI